MKVLAGRFGPYIASGGVNANIPKGSDPAEVTMEQAVALLAERAAKGRRPEEEAGSQRSRQTCGESQGAGQNRC